MSLNKVFVTGRLVADPELKSTPNGVSVTTVRVACDRDIKNQKTGKRDTDFFNVVAWRNTAEFLARYFGKGSMITVVGRLEVREYTDRDGNKRTAAEIVAENIYFGESKNSSGPAKAEPYGDSSGRTDGYEELTEEDGELPF